MSSALYASFRLICETENILTQVERLTAQRRPSSNRFAESAWAANQICLICLNFVEIGALIYGASSQTLEKIKSGEKICRAINIPAQNVISLDSERTVLNYLERGILAPIVSFLRASNEHKIYQTQNYLQMTPEELSKVKIPVYDVNPRGVNKIIGSKNITPEEAKLALTQAKALQRYFNIVETIFNFGPISTAEYFYRSFGRRLQIEAAAEQNAEEVNHETKVFDLLARKTIPEDLHDDVVFKRYICPITQAPIRFPVGDPNGVTLYEKEAITQALRRNPISPVTRLPLAVHQLVEKPALQNLINNRLQFHESRLQSFMSQGLEMSTEDHLQNEANKENPKN